MTASDRVPSALSAGSKMHHRGGQPLVAFGLVLAIWIAGRIAFWQSPFPAFEAAGQILARGPDAPGIAGGAIRMTPWPEEPLSDAGLVQAVGFVGDRIGNPVPHQAGGQIGPVMSVQRLRTGFGAGLGHQLLLMNALSRSAVLPFGVKGEARFSGDPVQMTTKARPAVAMERAKPERWSADSWLFVRSAETRIAQPGVSLGTYGASQAGAVLRYNLQPDSPVDPKSYLRIVRALAGSDQTDVAAGMSVRPLKTVPVAVLAELRASRSADTKDIRPALLAVTEIDPLDLPLGTRMRVYGQAGYVGGTFATAFADGQAVIDHAVTEFDLAELRAGAGVWGGAQRGVHRVDLGPTMQAQMRMADVPVTIAVDYRHRVAGNAEPQSGMALTVSTSF